MTMYARRVSNSFADVHDVQRLHKLVRALLMWLKRKRKAQIRRESERYGVEPEAATEEGRLVKVNCVHVTSSWASQQDIPFAIALE